MIDFGNEINLGDLGLSKFAIDQGNTLVLPRSRDIRHHSVPGVLRQAAQARYFGFAKTRFGEATYRMGEPVQFYVREDATDEQTFFKIGLESHELQGIYLQPDSPQVNNPETLIASTVAGSEIAQSTLMGRLAAQLHVDFKGLSLIGKTGKRISSVAATASDIRWRPMARR